MKWKLLSAVMLVAAAVLAIVLVSTRPSQAQATNPAPTVYTYKIVPARGDRELKNLEQRLNDDARNGWRVCSSVARSFNDELVVILEKPGATP